MYNDLKGKVAIVTGGARGIGAAIVRQLGDCGTKVVIADEASEGVELAARLQASGTKARFVRTDVSRQQEVQVAVDTAEREFGGVDYLVNGAGIFPRASLLETTEELWDRVQAVNLKGAFLACKAVLPAMIRRGQGGIVNIGSLHAGGGAPNLFAYSVSKGGLVTLSRNLSRALAVHRIRVNCVHPGWVATEGEIKLRRKGGLPDSWLTEQGRQLPLGRLQDANEIASMVVFLLSGQASQITGQEVAVDGGMGLQW